LLCNKVCDIRLYTLSHYMCWSCLLHIWDTLSLPLESGCDRSGSRGMLTIGRNQIDQDKTLTYLPLLWFFLYFSWFCLTLWLFYSDNSYLFYSKRQRISYLGILYLRIPKYIGDLRQYIYILSAWMFVLMTIPWFTSLIEWNSCGALYTIKI
jgi:hypothetical protein